jgi:preprotein translocase subunit SecA
MFEDVVREHIPAESVEEQWNVPALQAALASEWALDLQLQKMLEAEPNLNDDDILSRVQKAADEAYQAKVELVGKEAFGGFERSVMLQSIDTHWREHLAALDHLRQGIHLRGYAQKNPKQEYKREAFELFGQMLDLIKSEVVRTVVTVRIQSREEIEAAEERFNQPNLENVHFQHADFDANASAEEMLAPTAHAEHDEHDGTVVNHGLKIGRNDPCFCGSGKKYKQCHGKLA